MSFHREGILHRRLSTSLAEVDLRDEPVSRAWIGPVIAACDFAGLIFLSAVSSAVFEWVVQGAPEIRPKYLGIGCLVAALSVSLLESRGLYTRSFVLGKTVAIRIINVWLAVFSVLAVSAFLFGIGREFSRGILLLYFVLGLAGLLGIRWLARRLLSRAIAVAGLQGRRVCLIGDRNEVSIERLAPALRRHGYTVSSVFLFDTGPEADLGAPVPWKEVADIGRSGQIDEIMVAVGWSNAPLIQEIVERLRILPVCVRLLPDHAVAKLIRRPITDIGLTRTIELKREPLRAWERFVKRACDITLAGGALIVLSPMLLLAAVLIKVDSPGPILFFQTRIGFNGRKFRICKFRTMNTLEDGPQIRQACRGDERVTRVGRSLRSSSVDELPQLVNVLIGDMSIVGPRPHAVAHDNQYDPLIANYAIRHHVKPGITGLAQVYGLRGETPTVDAMLKRVEYDIWYIDNWSLWLDCVIIARTAIALMRPQNAH